VVAIHQWLLALHYAWSMDLPRRQRLPDLMGFVIGEGMVQIVKPIIAPERIKAPARQE
jgi:hypothetical protein